MSGTRDTSNSGLRVAFLIDRWDPQRGGAERAMAQLAEHLIARGHTVLAVALEHAPGSPGEHVRVTTSGLTRSARERKLARSLVAAARDHRADVTIGIRHLYECDLYWPHGGAHRATLNALVCAGLEHFGAHDRGRHATFLELERELLERGGARKIACVSQLVFDELAREYPSCYERLVLVENGVESSKFHPSARATAGAALRREIQVADDMPLLVFAARNPMLKGFAVLLDALDGMAGPDIPSLRGRRDFEWRLLIAGARPPRWGKQSLPADIAWRTSWREHVDPIALWSAADLCVLPTWRDTSGLAILESLACGTPVITTRSAGAHDIVTDDAGTVIRAGNSGELYGALASWLGRMRLGEIDRAAIRACIANRDSAAWLAKLEALVVELAASKKSS